MAAMFALLGCTTSKTETPPLTGPSGLGTSLVVTVSPDTVAQDGASQSLVQIAVNDSAGQPKRNVAMRVEIAVDGALTDYGRLSARTVVTDTAGRASVVYTAPPPILGVTTGVVVQILVTPTEGDFGNATARVVNIRVVPTGVIGPPSSPIIPDFVAPSATVGNPVSFAATFTGGTLEQIVGALWDFGDGQTSGGLTTTHTYQQLGTYVVTFAILDSLGRTNSVTKSVQVTQGALPVATFVFSPQGPIIDQIINFNASGSVAEPGHRITDYSWNFGDGTLGGGVLTTHAYHTVGTYIVTLVVTDDVGRKSSLVTQSITVTNGNPVADFTFNPTAATCNVVNVVFDGSPSLAAPGRTIVSYAWTFGDGATGSGQVTSHKYLPPCGALPRTFNVQLTVTDSAGRTGSAIKTITVNP